MHPNPAYRSQTMAKNLDYARSRGFGALIISSGAEPVVSHVPFVLSSDHKVAAMHLVRSNPILRQIGDGVRALLSVSGPDAYVSPDWYGIPDQVPTWNYLAVHLRGTLHRLPQSALRPHLEELSASFEARLDKKPWTISKMSPDVMARMERAIIPVAMTLDDTAGTWKLGQNKATAVRIEAAGHIAESDGPGADTIHLAEMMKNADSA